MSENLFLNKLSTDIGRLYLSKSSSDIDILVENEAIPCHTLLLSARSKYLSDLLVREASEKHLSIDAPLKAFKEILKYIYTGKIDLKVLSNSVLLDALSLSVKFMLKELQTEIESFINPNIQTQNVSEVFEVSKLHELSELSQKCLNFIDQNAKEVLDQGNFPLLKKESVLAIVERVSLDVPEIEIFNAVKRWLDSNSKAKPQDVSDLKSKIRLPLISTDDLLSKVRPTKMFDCSELLDAIQIKSQQTFDRLHRGKKIFDKNIATTEDGAKIIQGISAGASILDSLDHAYDGGKGYVYYILKPDDTGILFELSNVYIVNHIKLQLYEIDNRSYSYFVEVSVDKKNWERVVDYSSYLCRSFQYIYFDERPVKYVRVTGTHNTANEGFHIVTIEVKMVEKVPKMLNKIISPKENVASDKKSAAVVEGTLPANLLNGNFTKYTGSDGYTYHIFGQGSITVQLGQPYNIGSFKMLLYDLDDRTYSFYIETSLDKTNWETVVDKREEKLKSWQMFEFEPRAMSFIRFTGTHNSANNYLHIVHFECPIKIIG